MADGGARGRYRALRAPCGATPGTVKRKFWASATEIFRGNILLTERGSAQTSLRMPKHRSRR
eukprot:6765657-Prymnesium_polylepis.1